jgi:hypothetical protein
MAGRGLGRGLGATARTTLAMRIAQLQLHRCRLLIPASQRPASSRRRRSRRCARCLLSLHAAPPTHLRIRPGLDVVRIRTRTRMPMAMPRDRCPRPPITKSPTGSRASRPAKPTLTMLMGRCGNGLPRRSLWLLLLLNCGVGPIRAGRIHSAPLRPRQGGMSCEKIYLAKPSCTAWACSLSPPNANVGTLRPPGPRLHRLSN